MRRPMYSIKPCRRLIKMEWGSADYDLTDVRTANLSDNVDALILSPPRMLTLLSFKIAEPMTKHWLSSGLRNEDPREHDARTQSFRPAPRRFPARTTDGPTASATRTTARE